MQTRSQTRVAQKLYEVRIDFDSASKSWNSNKKRLENGCYSYLCGKKLVNGSLCQRTSTKGETLCARHKLI